jgi:TRAP-type C4-dicarboxylate transport system permease small subunit
MAGIWHRISTLYFKLLDVLNFVSLLLIFFVAFWMSSDVVSRSVFNRPFPGTSELVKSLLPAIVFLSLAYTLRHERHVRVEILLDRLPEKGRNLLNMVASLIGFSIFLVVAIFSWEPAWQGWLVREYEGVQLKVPVYPIRFVTVLGAGLFSLQFLINFFESVMVLLNIRRRPPR